MIRRALIVTLTFSASMCAVAGIASLTYPFVCTAGDPRGGLIAGSVWLMARSGFDDGAPHCFAADKDGPIFWKPELLRDGQGIAAVILPLWIPFVALAAYPTTTFIRGPLRRWRRTRAGACVRCGYDLTGNESGVCPECGNKIDSAA